MASHKPKQSRHAAAIIFTDQFKNKRQIDTASACLFVVIAVVLLQFNAKATKRFAIEAIGHCDHKKQNDTLQTLFGSSTMSRPSSNQSAMIIFDWDDTILPSSFVDKAQADNLNELPQQYHTIFREIELCAEKCLAAAAKHGEVSLGIGWSTVTSTCNYFHEHFHLFFYAYEYLILMILISYPQQKIRW